jgi:hypothetical protein
MINMKRNVFLVPFFAVLTLMLVGFASASLTTQEDIYFNDELISGSVTNVAGFSGESVPIVVRFEAAETSEDVKIKVEIYDGRDDFTATTGRFNVIDGNVYRKLLNVELPSDLDESFDDLTLKVRIYDADHDTDDFDEDFVIKMQRESYTLEILTVDYNSKVSAGDVFPVSVVLKNIGFNRVDDNYVVASIPELGISTRGYAGDLIPTEDYIDYDDEEDSTQKTVYLRVPESAEPGVYELEVEAYNKDSSVTVRKLVSVGDSGSTVILAAVKNQDMNAGETKTYDLVIVNSADDVKVFNINAVSGSDLAVSVPSVVTVGPDASETVTIAVTASDNADVGTYTFSVDVDGRQTVFGANVVGRSVSASMVALTVILVIVFIVLLAVLVILLTKKEKPIEEVETSYY